MFDENFTFASSSADVATLHVAECTSADISPYTSRCSSPKFRADNGRSRRDSRFDTYGPPRHPSVTALTYQLEHHAISESSDLNSPVSMSSPADSTSDQDEGFYDGPETPSTPYSDYSADDQSLFDLNMNMSDFSVTSSPRPSMSLEAQAMSSYTQRRRHRQALVRLQCFANKAPGIAMLLEECHPSELPWTGSKSRSNSTISLGATGTGRIEKDSRPTSNSSVRKPHRMRKRATR